MAVTSTQSEAAIYERPVELLQRLIRFDTTNPPGNEAACVAYIDSLLREAGIETRLLSLDPSRPNLIARLKGRGDAPPLLLHGHVDVVTTLNQRWRHAPFEGALADGCVWGRGALDMKGAVAMMLSAFLRAHAEGASLAGDVVLLILSDEENGSDYGARYLTEQHAGLFEGVKYAIGEGGGGARYVEGRRFYPVMVAEKQICWVKATVRGPGGHASRPMRGGTMARLGRLLGRLDESRLPVHVTPVARQMLSTMASALPGEAGSELAALLDPATTDATLDRMGPRGLFFDPILHNTVNATIVHGGHKINVIPSEVEVQLDGRILPGQGADDLLREIREVVGEDVGLEVMRHDASSHVPDLGLYPTLAGILKEADPEGVPAPFLLFAVTDGRYFAKLGIQPYGFVPLNLPEEPDFVRLVHAADERVPVSSLEFGCAAMYQLLQRFGGEGGGRGVGNRIRAISASRAGGGRG